MKKIYNLFLEAYTTKTVYISQIAVFSEKKL